MGSRLSKGGRTAAYWSCSAFVEEKVHLYALAEFDTETNRKFSVRGPACPHPTYAAGRYNVVDELECGLWTADHLQKSEHCRSSGMIPTKMYPS